MDLDTAVKAHGEWKIRLREAIQKKEKIDARSLSADDRCPLGQWLHGEARGRYSGLKHYGACVARHAEFHRQAGKVAEAINAGRYAEAETMLGGGKPYATSSSDVGVSILALRREARL